MKLPKFLITLLVLLFTLQLTGAALWARADTPPATPTAAQPADNVALVARIYFRDQADLQQLAATMDVWEVHHSPLAQTRYMVALLPAAQVQSLRQAGYRVVIDSAKTALLSRQPIWAASPHNGIPGYACYRLVEETDAALAQLAVDHPNLASWSDIGDSWEKKTPDGAAGYDLHALVLTNRTRPGPKPIFFLLAAIHARELATAELATRFAEYLVNNYGRDPDVTWLLDYQEVHIVPYGNPDGRKHAEDLVYWRKNTNRDLNACPDESPYFSYYGVDLNRNSSFKWNTCGEQCSSSDICRDTYRGATAASEPETQAIEGYVQSIFPDQRGPADNDAAPVETTGLLISLHSYGRQVLFPWGATTAPSPNDTQLETLGRKFGYYTGYEVCQSGEPNCIYPTDGATDDWSYGALGVASYTFEVGAAFFEECSSFETTVLPESFPALFYAAKAARRPYQTPSGPESLQVTVVASDTISGFPVLLRATADDTRYASHGWGDEPSQPIAAARYTIGAPSWITTTQIYSMTAADGQFDTPRELVQATVDTMGWTPGRYTVFVESQDVHGNWGVPTAQFIEIRYPLYLPLVMQ